VRVVHLANHAQNIGNGIVNMMIDLACMQARVGHEVTVASSGGNFQTLLAREGVRHVTIAQSPRLQQLPTMMAGFRHMIAESNPDIVHAHMTTGALLARFGILRRRYSLVTTVHNEFQKTASLMRVGDCVVAVTHAVAASMERRGVPKERLYTVLNGTVGAPRFAQVPLPQPPELKHPCIVTLAGMYERKGIRDILHAFALLSKSTPGASLYLIGEGPDRVSFEKLAKELGVAECTHFMGFVADPRSFLAEADVFVLASHKEAAGLALSEAREAGCAIVATRVDGIPEMLDGGEAGALVPAFNPKALAQAIELLLTDKATRNELRERARCNLQSFHLRRVCEEYLSIYLEGLEARSALHQRCQQAATPAQRAEAPHRPAR
jgi:glycosyltransferase involved in cell wall biosynthesis